MKNIITLVLLGIAMAANGQSTKPKPAKKAVPNTQKKANNVATKKPMAPKPSAKTADTKPVVIKKEAPAEAEKVVSSSEQKRL
jgi:hypothetical protein